MPDVSGFHDGGTALLATENASNSGGCQWWAMQLMGAYAVPSTTGFFSAHIVHSMQNIQIW